MKSLVHSEPVWCDDFAGGLQLGAWGSPAKWSIVATGPCPPDDGVVSKTANGISVTPPGRNPASGEPAFSLTMPQNGANHGIPGELDHAKWMALVNAQSPSGALGFPTPPGSVLSVEAVLGGETFGTHDHPFGDAVTDPDGDIRLAMSSLIVADMESGLVFDFALTNSTIYAIYERVAFARPALGHYAAFVFGVPLARRTREDMHKLRISYDRDANVISWLIEDVEVFRVTEPGKWIERTSMILDKGGQEQPAVMNQLCAGLGLVTILDGAIAGGPALVNLTGIPGDFDPAQGEPVVPTFVDNASKPASRLFGQGARLDCHSFTIYRA